MCWLNGRPPGHVEMGSVLFDDDDDYDDDDDDDDDDDYDDDPVVLWNKKRIKDEQSITNSLRHFSPALVWNAH